MIKFYADVESNPKSPKYLQKLGLYRWREESNKLYLEKWDGSKWVPFPQLIEATGMGGCTDFERISSSEARELIRKFTPDKTAKDLNLDPEAT